MYETIVVPLDDSETSRRALPTAVLLGRAWGVPVQVVTVESPGMDTTEAKYWLDRAIDEIDVPTRSPVVLESNDVASAVTAFVAECAPSLLCLSTHGRSAIGSIVLGSTAAEIIAAATDPLLLVGPLAVPGSELRTIVVAVEPIGMTLEYLRPVLDVARLIDARLHLVSVLTDAAAVLAGEDEVRGRLVDLADACAAAGVETSCAVPEADDIAATLVEAARATPADAIAVNTRAHRGLARLLLGSTAAHVVRRAPCPVLVIPPSP